MVWVWTHSSSQPVSACTCCKKAWRTALRKSAITSFSAAALKIRANLARIFFVVLGNGFGIAFQLCPDSGITHYGRNDMTFHTPVIFPVPKLGLPVSG